MDGGLQRSHSGRLHRCWLGSGGWGAAIMDITFITIVTYLINITLTSASSPTSTQVRARGSWEKPQVLRSTWSTLPKSWLWSFLGQKYLKIIVECNFHLIYRLTWQTVWEQWVSWIAGPLLEDLGQCPLAGFILIMMFLLSSLFCENFKCFFCLIVELVCLSCELHALCERSWVIWSKNCDTDDGPSV